MLGFSSQPTQAQGTAYLSNLGEGRFTGVTLENGQWLAQPFKTGTASAGYNLDSIQVLVASEVQRGSIHDTGSFNFFLYSDQNGQPENNLGSLSGFNTIGLGTLTYTASGIILSASTTYWIVATEVVPTGSSLAYIWESRDANFNNPNNPFDSGSQ